MITITIDTSNDAFQPSPNDEVARILRVLAADFERGDGQPPGFFRRLLDHNGNHVGNAKCT